MTANVCRAVVALAIVAGAVTLIGSSVMNAQPTSSGGASEPAGSSPSTAAAPAKAEHSMPYRILWTWDSWLCDPDSAESYVGEYRKLIDFMAEREYNGLIIWGFLDDRHGGIPAAKEVASYGARKGVRVMPGIGAGGYDGFYITPASPYNLRTFLKGHPELRAIPRRGSSPSGEFLCLYQDGAIDWLREASAWLAENFEIGGVNIETNESDGIDNCPHAAEATGAEPNRLRYAASVSDLARAEAAGHQS